MLAALGVRFRDATGRGVPPVGRTLTQITEVDASELADLSGVELVVATDVTNPLLGADGAAAVFGPQKGATPIQVRQLETSLNHLSRLLGADRTLSLHRGDVDEENQPTGDGAGVMADAPGAGAAGGLGFACRWLGARRVAGAEFFLDLLGFDAAVANCTAVITGEGRMDRQTLAGKLPAVVAARSAPRPVHAVVGRSLLSEDERRRLGVEQVHALSELSDVDSSQDPALSRRLAAKAGELIGQQLRSLTVTP